MNVLIKEARRKKKLTQVELGKIIRSDQTHIGKLEKGEIQPFQSTIKALADTLEIDPELIEISFGCLPKKYIVILKKYPAEMAELFHTIFANLEFDAR